MKTLTRREASPADAPAPTRTAAGASPPLRSRVLRVAEPLAVVVVLLAAWEAISRGGLVNKQDLPPVTTVLKAFFEDLQTSELWSSVGNTALGWGIGLGIVIAVGVPLGALLGSSRIAYRASNLTLEFVRTIPSIAALPLLILIYGTQLKLTVVLVVLTALWPLLINTMYGMHDVDPVARETARVYGLGRVRIFLKVTIPSALPYIATGLRLSGVIALILAIAATLIAGGEGLGAAISEAAQSARTPVMYARILTAGLMGLLVTTLFVLLERRFLRWHASQRRVA